MELDKRIKDIGAIMTCFSIEAAKEYLGQQGYFTSEIIDYQDLEKHTDFRTLDEIHDDDRPFIVGNVCYAFFLPAAFVKPVEKKKKWRPFTLDEFRAKFPLLSPVTFRRKKNGVPKIFCFVGYTADGGIILGTNWFNPKDLFDRYELKDKDGWTPFGVEE